MNDEQGKKWLLQKLYDDGWRYCVMDNFDNLYLTNEKPSMFDDVDEIRISSCKKAMGVSAFKNVLPKLKCNELLKILIYVLSAAWGYRICNRYGYECLLEFTLFLTIMCLIWFMYM